MLSLLSRLLHRSVATPSPSPTRANVGVFQRGSQLLLAGDDETEAGFWIATARIRVLPVSTPAAVLGAALHAALAESRVGVPTPRFGTGAPALDAPLWRATGVRSRRAFMAGTRFCVVSQVGSDLTVTATHNGGSTGNGRGWHPVDAPPRHVPAAAPPEALGAAVLAALDDATLAAAAAAPGTDGAV